MMRGDTTVTGQHGFVMWLLVIVLNVLAVLRLLMVSLSNVVGHFVVHD